jgi:Reverse transcriptase (RNA-dependent DNA polymerase)
VDYRQLNKVTKPDAYPLPKIADMLDAMAHCKFFSTLDLTSGFWQVRMNAQDQEKTAFSTKFGTYEFTVMPFGLMNAPATFQRLMDNVFYDVTWKFVLVYMDDIIIYSKTLEDHRKHLEQVLQLLINAGLKLNPDKCDFF